MIALWARLGLFRPPWLVAPAIAALTIAVLLVGPAAGVVGGFIRFRGERRLRELIADYYVIIKSFFLRLIGREDVMFDPRDLNLVAIGLVPPEEYAAELGLDDVRKSLDKLEELNVGGHEIELFEALRARERKLLQESTLPTVLDLSGQSEDVPMGTAQSRGTSNGPVELFFSYSHKDEGLRDELAKHLKPLEREGSLKSWHDRRVGPGGDFRESDLFACGNGRRDFAADQCGLPCV